MPRESNRIKILIVDDEEMIRHCYAEALSKHDQFLVVGVASNGKEALKLVKKHNPQVVLMDIVMPVMDGVRATAAIMKENPHIKVMGFTGREEGELIKQMVEAGVCGFIHKGGYWADLEASINMVANGGTCFPKRILENVLKSAVSVTNKPKNKHGFSEKELQILRFLASDMSPKEVGLETGISERSVTRYIKDMRERVGFSNTSALVRYALENGII